MKPNARRFLFTLTGAALALFPPARALAARTAPPAAIRRRATAFLTRVYAWQGIHQILILKLGPAEGGLRRMTVRFSNGQASAMRNYWVTTDGRDILNGTRFPLAPAGSRVRQGELRARILAYLHQAYPKAKVTINKIGPPDRSGVRKVTASAPKPQVYWVTRGKHSLLDGEKDPMNGDPWASVRRKIELHGAPAIGPANAPVTIVEFSDLECPYCREESGVLNQLRAALPNQVRLVFKLYPLTQIHPWAMDAALAATCVTQQDPAHFWNFEQAVFDAQPALDAMMDQNPVNPFAQAPVPARIPARLRDFALESGTEAGGYDACLKAPQTRKTIEASLHNGDEVGVESTPTLFINGQRIPGAVPLSDLLPLVSWLAKQPRPAPRRRRLALRRRLHGPQCGLCRPLPPLPAKPQPAATPHR